MDRLTPEKRSALMRNVKAKHTTPELTVRSMLHRMGFRFQLHRKDLPGKPDIVFPSRKKIVLVNGCFWHGHDCRYGRLPKSKLDFWEPKIEGSRARDVRNIENLRNLGWDVLTVWQCETRDPASLEQALTSFIDKEKKPIDTGHSYS
jgi:DNA mismatch endonuclease (patch repair protein)